MLLQTVYDNVIFILSVFYLKQHKKQKLCITRIKRTNFLSRNTYLPVALPSHFRRNVDQ